MSNFAGLCRGSQQRTARHNSEDNGRHTTKTGGKPQMFYTDEEGSLYSNPVIEEKVKLHGTQGMPLSLRIIRTYEDICFFSELKVKTKVKEM